MTRSEIRTLSAVVPAFNERENLRPLVQELRAQLQRLDLPFEIVVVDDGSDDGSWELLVSMAAEFPELHILRLASRGGQSGALSAGFDIAHGEAIVTLDADLQNDPADIPVLLDRLLECDLVNGIRRRRKDNWKRRWSSRIANAVRKAWLGDGVTDTCCAVKAFRREWVAALPRFKGMHRFLPALVQIRGGRVLEVEVNHRERRWGRTKYGVGNRLVRGLVDTAGVWWLRHRALDTRVERELTPRVALKPMEPTDRPVTRG